MNPRVAIEADILAVGYQLCYFSESDIERWADFHIAEETAPSEELLNLSVLRNVYPVDVIKRIRAVGSSELRPSAELHIGIIGLLIQHHDVGLEAAMRSLYSLIHDEAIDLSPALKSDIYDLDDRYDTAVAGIYGTLSEVDSALRQFVAPYSERLREDYPRLIGLHKAS